jgi:hypothetical protein
VINGTLVQLIPSLDRGVKAPSACTSTLATEVGIFLGRPLFLTVTVGVLGYGVDVLAFAVDDTTYGVDVPPIAVATFAYVINDFA